MILSRKTKKIIQVCRKHPVHLFPEILEDHGFQYKFVDNGLSRQVYKILGLPIVIKIEDGDSWQSRNEVKAISQVVKSKKRYKKLKSHIPKIYYAKIRKNGCLILAHYYPLAPSDVPANIRSQACVKLENLFTLFPISNVREICGDNIRFTRSYRPIAVDLGYGRS